MERLQKIISAAGIASRRKAEEFITSGRVQVNGQTVTELGTKADAEKDHIRVDGKLLKRVDHHVYLLLNKPKGYVTTLSDPEGRPTILDLLHGVKTRVYPVGRLDYASEGLLLLTNDGEIANALTKAASHVPKTYLVKVDGQPNDAAIERLRLGISLPDRKGIQTRTAPAGIQIVHKAENPWYEVTLIEGRNRQVRKMFEETGHHVEKLKRVRYGPFTLDVHPGKFRYLKPEEVERLQAAVQRGESSPEDTRVVLDAHIASDTRSPKSNYADFDDELENELESAPDEIVPSALPPRKPARSTKTPPARTEAAEFEDRPTRPAAPFKAAPFRTGSVKTGSFKPRAGGPREAKSRRDGFKRNDFRKFDARRAEGRETSPNTRPKISAKAGKPGRESARVETGASPVRSYPPSRPAKTFSKGPARPGRMESRGERPFGKKPSGPRAGGFGARPSGGPPRSGGLREKWAGGPASSEARAPQGARRPNSFGPRGDRTQSARPHIDGPRTDRPRSERPRTERPAGRNFDGPRRDAIASPRPEFRAQRPDWKKPDAVRSNFSGNARPGPRTPRSGRPSGKPGKWVKGISASTERPSPRVAKSREEFRPKSRVREVDPRSEEGSSDRASSKNQSKPFWKKAAEKRRPGKGKKNRPH